MSDLGHHCIFLFPKSKKSNPPGLVTLAPSVSSLVTEGILVPYISIAACSEYGGSQFHLSNRFFHSWGRYCPSRTLVGFLSGFMSTVTSLEFATTSPEHTSISSPD